MNVKRFLGVLTLMVLSHTVSYGADVTVNYTDISTLMGKDVEGLSQNSIIDSNRVMDINDEVKRLAKKEEKSTGEYQLELTEEEIKQAKRDGIRAALEGVTLSNKYESIGTKGLLGIGGSDLFGGIETTDPYGTIVNYVSAKVLNQEAIDDNEINKLRHMIQLSLSTYYPASKHESFDNMNGYITQDGKRIEIDKILLGSGEFFSEMSVHKTVIFLVDHRKFDVFKDFSITLNYKQIGKREDTFILRQDKERYTKMNKEYDKYLRTKWGKHSGAWPHVYDIDPQPDSVKYNMETISEKVFSAIDEKKEQLLPFLDFWMEHFCMI